MLDGSVFAYAYACRHTSHPSLLTYTFTRRETPGTPCQPISASYKQAAFVARNSQQPNPCLVTMLANLQAYPEQEYAPGLAPDAYLPRDAPPLSRSHTYHEEPRGGDPSYMPPQHAQSAPPRYDSPMPGYAPPLAQEPHQPVYGSGAAPMQGYTSTAPAPIERQPYYPPQQQPHQQGGPSQQQQQYADGSGYGREPAYSSAPCGYAAPQGGYMDNPPALTPRGGYSQTAPVSVPRHRSDEYDPGYSGRSQGYGAQGRPLSTAPVSHGGVSHDAGRPRAAPRGGSQAWAPSPREAAYVGAPHVSGMLWLSFPPIAPFSQHCCCIWRALSKE